MLLSLLQLTLDTPVEIKTDVPAGLGIGLIIVYVLLYVYMAICLQTMAKKTNTQNPWLAWIPVANMFLMIMIAKKPLWWFLLMLIPFVNIIFIFVVWAEICKNLGKSPWLVILFIVPIANLILPGYLAFSQSTLSTPARA